MTTELEKIVLKFPDVDWDWKQLSKNPNISYKFMKENPCSLICKTENFNCHKQHCPEFKWDLSSVLMNPNIDHETKLQDETLKMHLFGKKIDEIDWNSDQIKTISDPKIWETITYITHFDTIMDNLHLPWDWAIVMLNNHWREEFIQNNLNLPWDWNEMAIWCSWNFIKNNPNINWDWNSVSLNSNITVQNIIENPDYDWDWDFVSQNPNLTWDFIKEKCYVLNWGRISQNPSVTWDIIRDNPDAPWEFKYICENPNITLDIIKNNPDYPWDLSSNPNITCEFISENINKKWNWYSISENKFGYSYQKTDYMNTVELLQSLLIFSNKTLPKYLLIEILASHSYDDVSWSYFKLESLF